MHTPPHDITLEKSILSTLMNHADAAMETSTILTGADFYTEAHRALYEAMQAIYRRSEPIDMMTIVAELRAQDTFTLVGGFAGVMECSDGIARPNSLTSYAHMLKALSLRRRLLTYSTEVQAASTDEEISAEDAIGRAMTGIDQIHCSVTRLSERSYSQIVHDTIAGIRQAAADDYPPGTPLYLRAVDRATGGWQDSDLIIVAARPGMGKTAFIIQAARRQAEAGIPVGIFSLEMSAAQNIQRIISAEIEADISTIRRGGLGEEQWQQLEQRTAALASLPIQICDQGGITLAEIVSTAKKWKLKHGIRVLYIDYLQLITVDRTSRSMNREQEISTISRRLKQLAKELQIPVIALSQLSRSVESRADRRPMLSDLRESGAIEQDADMVMFLYRPEYYGIAQDERYDSTRGICEVILAKYRNGEPCNLLVRFIPQYFRFDDKDKEY